MHIFIRNESPQPDIAAWSSGRRTFLKLSACAAAAIGISTGGGALFAIPMEPKDKDKVDLGSGDTGILNYAYALEQLEAAFYTQALSAPYTEITSTEREILTDIRDHEIVHREFFKAALGANAIPALEPNFSKIKWNERKSVLETAKTFEDLGVAAYNGAGRLLTNGDFLLLAGKIVSVEARHASAIRDLLGPRSGDFAPDALDGAKSPKDVLKAAGPFIKTKIEVKNLPGMMGGSR
ncbi:MAG TPA: ferritin-like domain-containing protein [Terriglobales bacterium]|nr:ferritin-like domain-containing protein [Terriglobales bacterium]